MEITPGVLFLYDNQLRDPRYLEDINNILNLGEVPNIFTTDEKNEVVESMKNLEAQLDKSLHTEGGLHELFALFIREALTSALVSKGWYLKILDL